MPELDPISTVYHDTLPGDIRRRLAEHPRREISDPELRPAAVVVPLVPGPAGLSVLLTRRTDRVEHHKGEICFPGGRVDPEDKDSLAAALRETWEEVGVHPEHLLVLGPLDDFVSISGYRVRPFAALLDRPDYPYAPEPREVDEILVIPTNHLLDPAHHRLGELSLGERRHRFHWQGRVVWGLTAAILNHFLRVALPRGAGA